MPPAACPPVLPSGAVPITAPPIPVYRPDPVPPEQSRDREGAVRLRPSASGAVILSAAKNLLQSF